MSNQDLTANLGPQELNKLLRVCSESQDEGPPLDADQHRRELLLDHLGEAIQRENAKNEILSEDFRHLCEISGIFTGVTLRDLLLNGETDPVLIGQLKDYYKQIAYAAAAQPEKDVAAALYYAAIGHALIFQKKKITSFSYRELEEAFTRFGRIAWITTELDHIFAQARECCRGDSEEKPE